MAFFFQRINLVISLTTFPYTGINLLISFNLKRIFGKHHVCGKIASDFFSPIGHVLDDSRMNNSFIYLTGKYTYRHCTLRHLCLIGKTHLSGTRSNGSKYIRTLKSQDKRENSTTRLTG